MNFRETLALALVSVEVFFFCLMILTYVVTKELKKREDL